VFRISGTSTLEDKMGSWRKEIAAIFITALKRRRYLEKNVAFQFRSPFFLGGLSSLPRSSPGIWDIIDHFIVVCSVTWPLDDSEARVDLVLIQTSLLVV